MYTQEEIVVAAAESNLHHQLQTVGTDFCQPALFDAFGPCADNEDNYFGVLDGSFIPHKDVHPHSISLLGMIV